MEFKWVNIIYACFRDGMNYFQVTTLSGPTTGGTVLNLTGSFGNPASNQYRVTVGKECIISDVTRERLELGYTVLTLNMLNLTFGRRQNDNMFYSYIFHKIGFDLLCKLSLSIGDNLHKISN